MSADKIKQAIQQMAGIQFTSPVFLLDCEVKSVDEARRECTVINYNGDAEVEIVCRIAPVVDDGVIIFPAVGSSVIVAYNSKIQPFILQFSRAEKVSIVIGQSSLEIVDGTFTFNDGNLNGMVKIDDLVDRLNRIENLLNQFIGIYNAHTHAGNGVPTTSLQTSTLTATTRAMIENEKIKQ